MHASPDALVVHLQRCVRWQNTELPGMQNVEGTTALTAVALAAWWPRPEDPRTDAYTRVLEGELRVPDDLVSSSAMGTFSISVRTTYQPSSAPACSLTCNLPVHRRREPAGPHRLHARERRRADQRPCGGGDDVHCQRCSCFQLYITEANATTAGLRPVAYAPPSYDVFTPRTLAGPSEGAMYTYAGGVNMGR
jgi:hypothetical protein